jgi:hypothetical protein
MWNSHRFFLGPIAYHLFFSLSQFLARVSAEGIHVDRKQKKRTGVALKKETKLIVGDFASTIAKVLSKRLGNMANDWIFVSMLCE